MKKKKILAVASMGGHWIQLLRITRCLENEYDVVYCSTNEKYGTMAGGHDFYVTEDFNRKNIWRLLPAFVRQYRMLGKIRPDVLLTTGAAPGLAFLLAARLRGIRTIWIDSIANVDRMSQSGKIATRIASRTYTQWPSLAGDKVMYAGNVFGDSDK